MEIDISKFQQVFFEDSLESINNVERMLVNFDLSKQNQEIIFNIFRCAHSIKGSSGMFGFTAITQFTHVLESYLENVRHGKTKLTQDVVELLLQSLDCLRNMINDLQQNKTTDLTLKNSLEAIFNRLLEENENQPDNGTEETQNEISTSEDNTSNLSGWKIYFKPDLKIFQHGDDPLRILRALKELGTMECTVDLKNLTNINIFYPDECYLAWNIFLETNQSEEDIRQHAFEWVEDKSEIIFTPIQITDQEGTQLSELQTTASETPYTNKELTSVRVPIEKVDELINMVGELVITQSMLTQISNSLDNTIPPAFKENLNHMEQNCRKLQENIMRIRMLPISNIFNRFPRMVHDLSLTFGKIIDLKMSGENTELDKTILEKMIDPLVHLVRNAVDHGIESPQTRKAQGKNEQGTLRLNSFHQGSNIIIEISDDGNGLDYNKITEKGRSLGLINENETPSIDVLNELIFSPGFSTAQKVTDISGRGMGMDVVLKNIKGLGGSISVSSIPGHGTTFSIFLPLTLAIIDGQLIRVGDAIYVIPLISMIETIQIKKQNLYSISNNTYVYYLREQYVPIIFLHQLFDITVKNIDMENHFLVIVELNQQTYGIMIDELLQLQQVVIKSLDNFYQVEGTSGVAILGDHTIAFILDVAGIIRLACEKSLPKALDLTSIKTVA